MSSDTRHHQIHLKSCRTERSLTEECSCCWFFYAAVRTRNNDCLLCVVLSLSDGRYLWLGSEGGRVWKSCRWTQHFWVSNRRRWISPELLTKISVWVNFRLRNRKCIRQNIVGYIYDALFKLFRIIKDFCNQRVTSSWKQLIVHSSVWLPVVGLHQHSVDVFQIKMLVVVLWEFKLRLQLDQLTNSLKWDHTHTLLRRVNESHG